MLFTDNKFFGINRNWYYKKTNPYYKENKNICRLFQMKGLTYIFPHTQLDID